MDGRHAVTRIGGGFLLLALVLLHPTALGQQRPNIIFLMSDQQRWDAVGAVNPLVKTPALDRLAREGVLFDQAVCQGPMCVPSRYSMMLGLYPSQIGVLSNAGWLSDEDLPCDPLPEVLRKAGYQTAGFGKTHWRARDCSTRGFEIRYIGQPSNVLREKGAVMMGDHDPEGLARYKREADKFGGGEENIAGYLGCTSTVPEEDHRDGWVFQRCLEFIEKGIDDDRPLFLYLSFLKPHAGHNVPAGHEGLYRVEDMPVPPQPPREQVEPCHATGTNREGMYRGFWRKATKKEWQVMRMRYYANCTWIDSMFGRVLKKLEGRGVLDNCLVVYVSDHGEMLGERYYRFNKYCLFDSSVRVPMILSGTAVPEGIRGTVDRRPAELVDVLTTVLKVAGAKAVQGKPGQDLLGPVRRSETFCELHHRGKDYYMWRNRNYKLILGFLQDRERKVFRPDAVVEGELYDLRNDPKEWKNLYEDNGHAEIARKMRAGLLDHLGKHLPRRVTPR